MSKLIASVQIIEGMVLEKAIKNKYGQLLIPANTLLEEKHKKLLKTWGITSAHIKSEEENPVDRIPENNQKSEELNLLYERFGWKPRNPNEEDLFEMVLAKGQKSGSGSGDTDS